MVTEKETEALKKLLKIVKSGSFELYATGEDNYYRIARSWPVEWEEELRQGRFKSEEGRHKALDKTLENFVEADFPSSVKQMKEERAVVRVILEAGADPNYYSGVYKQKLFDVFLNNRKSYIALEMAQTDGFVRPGNIDKTFVFLADSLNFYLQWKRPYPGKTKEEAVLHAQNCQDRKELVYVLFQKGIYPHDEEVFTKLAPVVLEREPDFFEKKRQQAITRLVQAKTPVQFFNALRGNCKEKE